ncbi:unnamed protein product [Rhodiola kirilowii]
MYESLDGAVSDLRRGPRLDKRPITTGDTPPSPQDEPLTGATRPPGLVTRGHLDVQPFEPPRLPKLEVQTFHGDGPPDGWLFQLERYFEHHSVQPGQRMMVATFHMAGEALQWFQWMHATHQIYDWPSLARDLQAKFGPSAYTYPEVAINLLTQTGSLAAYIKEFETLSIRTPDLTHSNLLHRFIAGLRPDIKRELTLFCPPTLQLAMGMARVADEKNQ